MRTSLVVQWIRIHLPMQGTWVRFLVQEDSTSCGAAKPVYYSSWAQTLEPLTTATEAQVPNSLCSTTREAISMRSPHLPQLEKARSQQHRPSAAKKIKGWDETEINTLLKYKIFLFPWTLFFKSRAIWLTLLCFWNGGLTNYDVMISKVCLYDLSSTLF